MNTWNVRIDRSRRRLLGASVLAATAMLPLGVLGVANAQASKPLPAQASANAIGPIKHVRKVVSAHEHYSAFAEFGDGKTFRKKYGHPE